MPSKKQRDAQEQEKERFRRGLDEVGRNLPDEPADIEGADVREVIRHDDGEEDADKRIARELAEPHEDLETDLVKELDLTPEEDEK